MDAFGMAALNAIDSQNPIKSTGIKRLTII
jgi:hypothetical protein